MMSFINRLKQYRDSAVAQVNPFDGGEDFRSRMARFDRQNIPAKPRIPLGDIPTNPLKRPVFTDDGGLSNMTVGGSVFNDGTGTFFDPTGHAGGNSSRYTNSNYLRIQPHFRQFNDIQPKEFATLDNLKKLLNR